MSADEASTSVENEELEDDEDDVETSESHGDSDGSTSASGGGSGGGGKANKKKKKKKKKKKSGEAGAASTASDAAASASKVDKAEAEKRYNQAVDAIKGGSEMWIKLSSSNLHDHKCKKLLDLLRDNASVTSLDMSQNHLSDEGAGHLASILGCGGCHELIELDLRENPFTETGMTILAGLQRIRRQLDIKLGPITAESTSKEVTKGPMFRKFFQTGDDDDSPSVCSETPVFEANITPEELWRKIKTLAENGLSSVPELTANLTNLTGQILQREVGSLQSRPEADPMDGTRPHIKGCLQHLSVLEHILKMRPQDVTTQFSSEPQTAIGTHRVQAAEVVAQLLSAGNKIMDERIAKAHFVSHITHLALTHPHNCAIQTRALRIIKQSCQGKVPDLMGPLFVPGWGIHLHQAGSEELIDPLPEQLADLATYQLDVVGGRRSPVMGFVIELCKVLRSTEEGKDNYNNSVVERFLQASGKWSEFVGVDGALQQLCQQQEGDLGGPRAQRVPMEEGSELAELAGGGMMSGHEILALLQNMGAVGMGSFGGG